MVRSVIIRDTILKKLYRYPEKDNWRFCKDVRVGEEMDNVYGDML